jgi:thioredoxin-like negative regulator of GroEL
VTGRFAQQGPAAHSSGQTSISFVDDCDAGRRLAEAANKPLLVVFRADWCRWSAAFSQQTLTDPAIVALADRFVCVQVDADRHSKICQRYAVSQFPTVLILDADNNELSRRSGHTLATDLKPLLRQALSPRQLAAVETPQATESVTATTDAGNQPAPVQLQTADMPGDEISR